MPRKSSQVDGNVARRASATPIRKTALERKFERVRKLAHNLDQAMPAIADSLVFEEETLLEFRVYLKPDGDYMALHKLQSSPTDLIAFGTGDSPIEAIFGLMTRIAERGHSEAKPYKARTKQPPKQK